MKVIWSERAKETARDVFLYIKSEFGERAGVDFLREIEKTSSLLQNNPHLGQLEPFLQDYTEGYRSIVVNRLTKLVYSINGQTVEIVTLWDTRREPKL